MSHWAQAKHAWAILVESGMDEGMLVGIHPLDLERAPAHTRGLRTKLFERKSDAKARAEAMTSKCRVVKVVIRFEEGQQ